MALEPGQRIGDRYTLVGRLGGGGMADVWLADDEMLGRRVALKFLHERFAQDANFVERCTDCFGGDTAGPIAMAVMQDLLE